MPLLEAYVIVTALTTVVPLITHGLTLSYLSIRASAGDAFEDLNSTFEHDRKKGWLRRGPVATFCRRANLYLIRKTYTNLKPEVDTAELVSNINQACSVDQDKGESMNPHARAATQRDKISDAVKATIAGTGLSLRHCQPSKRDKGEIAAHQSYHLKDAIVHPYDKMRVMGKRSGGNKGDAQGVTMSENVFQYYTAKQFGNQVGRGDVVIGSDFIPLTAAGEECEMTFVSDGRNNLIVNGPNSGPWFGGVWDLGGCEENLYIFDVSRGSPFLRRMLRYATGIKRKILMRVRVFRPFKDNPGRCVTIWEPICRFSTYDSPFHTWEATELKRVDFQQYKSQFVKNKEWNVRVYKDGPTNTEIVSCAKPNNKNHVEFKREIFESMLGMRQAYCLNTILSSAGVKNPATRVAYTSIEVELAKQLFSDLAKEKDYKDFPIPFVTTTGVTPNLYISSQVVFSGNTVEEIYNWMATAGCPLQNAAHVPNQRDPNSQYDGIVFRNSKGRNSAEMIHLPLPLTLAMAEVLPDPTKVVNLNGAYRWCFTCKAYHVNSTRNWPMICLDITRNEEMMHAGELHQLALNISECACHQDEKSHCVRCDCIMALVTQLISIPCAKACHDFGHAGNVLTQTSRKFFSDTLRAIHDADWAKARAELAEQEFYEMPDTETETLAKFVKEVRNNWFVRDPEDDYQTGRGCANCQADLPPLGDTDVRVTEASFCVPVNEALCERCLRAIPECVANSTTLTPGDISFQFKERPTRGMVGPLPPVVNREEVVHNISRKDPKFETLGPRHGLWTKRDIETYVWRNFNARGTPYPYTYTHESPCDGGADCYGLRNVGVCRHKHTKDEIEINFKDSPIAPRVEPPRKTAIANIHAWAKLVSEVWGIKGSDQLGGEEYPFKAWDNDQIMAYFKKSKHKKYMLDYEYLVEALYDDDEDIFDVSKREEAANRFAEAVWHIKDFVPTGSEEDKQKCREILGRVGFKGGIEAFLKSEASGGFPRIISSWRDFHFIAEHTRYMAPITTWFKEHHAHWFMPGKTPPELATAISEFINSINGAEAESDDYSGFDMLRSGALQQVVSIALMEGMPQHEQAAYAKMMNEVMTPEGGARMKMQSGDEYIIFNPGEGQKSGNAGTTGDNTLCCGALNIIAIFLVLGGYKGMAAFKTSYIEAQSKMVHNIRRHLSPCSGDDGVSNGRFSAMKKSVAKSLGMELTTEHVYQKDGYVVFLQRVYCFIETENPQFTIFSPSRQLPKIHLRRNPDNSSFYDLATLQGHELLINDPWTPIVSSFAAALIANYQRYCSHSYKHIKARHETVGYAGASDRSYNYELSIEGGPWPSDINLPHYQAQARDTIAHMIGTTSSEVMRVDRAFRYLADNPKPVAQTKDFVGLTRLVKGKFYVPAVNLHTAARKAQVEHLMKVHAAGRMPDHWKGDPKDYYDHPLYCVPPIQNELTGKGMTWDGHYKSDDPQRRLTPEQSAAYAQLLADFAAKRGATSSVRHLFSAEILALVFGATAMSEGNAPGTTGPGEDGGEDARRDTHDAQEQEAQDDVPVGVPDTGNPGRTGPAAGPDITHETGPAGGGHTAAAGGGQPPAEPADEFAEHEFAGMGPIDGRGQLPRPGAGNGGGGASAPTPAPRNDKSTLPDVYTANAAPLVDSSAPGNKGFAVTRKLTAACLMCGVDQVAPVHADKGGGFKKIAVQFPWCLTHLRDLPECTVPGCRNSIRNPYLAVKEGKERVCQQHAVKKCSICNKLILSKVTAPDGTVRHATGDPECITVEAFSAKLQELADGASAPVAAKHKTVDKGKDTVKHSGAAENKNTAKLAPIIGDVQPDTVNKRRGEVVELASTIGNTIVCCSRGMSEKVAATANKIPGGLTIGINCEALVDHCTMNAKGAPKQLQWVNPHAELVKIGLGFAPGTDSRVQEYIWSKEDARIFRIAALARVLATLGARTIKPASVTIIVTCRAGVHRSQALACWLQEQLAENGLTYAITIARRQAAPEDEK